MLYTIIIGFLAGLVAKMLYPGKQGGGIIVTLSLIHISEPTRPY